MISDVTTLNETVERLPILPPPSAAESSAIAAQPDEDDFVPARYMGEQGRPAKVEDRRIAYCTAGAVALGALTLIGFLNSPEAVTARSVALERHQNSEVATQAIEAMQKQRTAPLIDFCVGWDCGKEGKQRGGDSPAVTAAALGNAQAFTRDELITATRLLKVWIDGGGNSQVVENISWLEANPERAAIDYASPAAVRFVYEELWFPNTSTSAPVTLTNVY